MRKLRFIGVILALFLVVGCTANMGNIPWELDIKNWSEHQRANFFMKTWMSEKATYDNMNAIEDKPETLIAVLKAKREILESSRIPIRTYANIVNSGGVPDAGMEQEIIQYLRQLQAQYVYGG